MTTGDPFIDQPKRWGPYYDVEGVPPIEMPSEPYEPPVGRWLLAWAPDGPLAMLYGANGRGVEGANGYGDPITTHYQANGRRKQYYWRDGEPASSYLPDGTQIPLYTEKEGHKLTDDSRDPLYPEQEPDPPEDPEDPEEPEDPEDPDPPEDPEDPEEPEDPEDPEEPGEPDPPPVLVDAATVQSFMPDDMIPDDVAALAAASAVALIDAYTRGRHLDARGRPRAGVSTVALTVAARIASNPGQVSRFDQAGSFSSRRGEGFSGFTLAELAVLNRYRKRAIGP